MHVGYFLEGPLGFAVLNPLFQRILKTPLEQIPAGEALTLRKRRYTAVL
jgi:hypothetical protein